MEVKYMLFLKGDRLTLWRLAFAPGFSTSTNFSSFTNASISFKKPGLFYYRLMLFLLDYSYRSGNSQDNFIQLSVFPSAHYFLCIIIFPHPICYFKMFIPICLHLF